VQLRSRVWREGVERARRTLAKPGAYPTFR
jgi:hypothetical protein